MTRTHTYSLLEISAPAFNEIAAKLKKASYGHAFMGNGEIDMHGIGLAPDPNVKAEDISVNVTSILSHRTREGRVQLTMNGVTAQMDLDKAREIVRMLQGGIEAAASDQMFWQFLTKQLDFPDDQAGAALLDFRELRQGSRDTVIPS